MGRKSRTPTVIVIGVKWLSGVEMVVVGNSVFVADQGSHELNCRLAELGVARAKGPRRPSPSLWPSRSSAGQFRRT